MTKMNQRARSKSLSSNHSRNVFVSSFRLIFSGFVCFFLNSLFETKPNTHKQTLTKQTNTHKTNKHSQNKTKHSQNKTKHSQNKTKHSYFTKQKSRYY